MKADCSIARRPTLPRIPGLIDPDAVHVGDVIQARGEEATVRDITAMPEGWAVPNTWVFVAVTGSGAEIVTYRQMDRDRHVKQPVFVVRAACPRWKCRQPGCRAHGRASSWLLAEAFRVGHETVWHRAPRCAHDPCGGDSREN